MNSCAAEHSIWFILQDYKFVDYNSSIQIVWLEVCSKWKKWCKFWHGNTNNNSDCMVHLLLNDTWQADTRRGTCTMYDIYYLYLVFFRSSSQLLSSAAAALPVDWLAPAAASAGRLHSLPAISDTASLPSTRHRTKHNLVPLPNHTSVEPTRSLRYQANGICSWKPWTSATVIWSYLYIQVYFKMFIYDQ